MAILTMGHSKQHSREHIMSQIPHIMHEFLQEFLPEDTVRIPGDVPNSMLDPEDYLESIHPFASKVQHCLHEYHTDNKTRFLAATYIPENTSISWPTPTTPVIIIILLMNA